MTDQFEPQADNWLPSLAAWLQQNGQPVASELVQITHLMICEWQAEDPKAVDDSYHRALATLRMMKEQDIDDRNHQPRPEDDPAGEP